MSKTYKFKTKPDAHQIAALKNAMEKRRYGIFFQQRVGKTKVAIDFCGAMLLKEWSNKIMIVCPLSVRTEWVAQLKDHFPFEYDVYLYPSTKAKREKLLEDTERVSKATFIILNYDILNNDLEELKEWCPHTLIFDESHLIGHYNSKRSKAAAKLGKTAKNVLLLTGTPIPKKWYHIYGQFRAMDDRIFGTNWHKFVNKWGIKGGYMGKEIVGCNDMEKLSRIIADNSIRVLRKDVFDEPQVENVLIPVTLKDSTRAMYDNLRTTFILELSKADVVTADLAITRMMRLQQLCGGFIKTDTGEMLNVGSEKIDTLVDLVNTKYEGNEQVVIFHRYRAEGQEIVNRLSKFCKVAEINGSVDEAERKKARDKFQAGELDAIVIQISTGGMGISLDRAHINIFYSLDFSLSNLQQARDRVMGRNQKTDVTNYFLAASQTMDEKVMRTLKNDEDVASKISDNWRWVLEEDAE